MQKITIKWISYLLLAIGCLSAVSCDNENRSVNGEDWFDENRKELLAINKSLLALPIIKRVESTLSLQFVPNSDKFDTATLKEYENIKSRCQRLGIENIDISRNDDGSLILISYTIMSSGIIAVAGGRSLSIEYLPDPSVLEFMETEERTYHPLKENPWYTAEYVDLY
ncbi:MAG: hypothetical protein P8163_18795 [Candidatus Thiodiazotropha sp.]